MRRSLVLVSCVLSTTFACAGPDPDPEPGAAPTPSPQGDEDFGPAAFPLQLTLTLQGRINQAVAASKAADEWYVGMAAGGITTSDAGVWYYGERSIGAGAPSFDTAFRIGSITKTMTGALLALQGSTAMAAKLKDELAAWCPSCGSLPNARKTITLLDLADHHSGLPRKPTADACSAADLYEAVTDCSVNDLSTSVGSNCSESACPPTCTAATCATTCNACVAPGNYLYSNWGFSVLGHLLADRVGAANWRTLDHDRVLDPLGMTHTLTDEESFSGLDKAGEYVCSGSSSSPTCTQVTSDYPTSANPAGGLWSTGPDMMRYLRFAMGVPPYTPNAGTNALYAVRSQIFTVYASPAGLAWQLAPLSGPTTSVNVWYKAGSWGQTSAYIAWIPSLGVGAYAMSNSGSTTGPKNVVNSVLKSYIP